MTKESLKILEFEGKRVVLSFDYYKSTGLKLKNYTRWMMENVLNNGTQGVDYFPAPGNTAGRTIRFRLRYYFDIDFAIAICLLIKRRESAEIRSYLLEVKGKKEDIISVKPDFSKSSIYLRNFKKKEE
jgi:phage anti-repressor protein